jgi:hypothetical protein
MNTVSKKEIELSEADIELSEFIFSVEKKMNGFHATVHKKGNEIRIFSEQKKELTNVFPTLIENIKKISDSSFIVDGELVPYDNKGNTLGRNELMKFTGAVKSGKKLDDSNINLHVWDITYLDKPVNELPLSERIKNLARLNFNNRVIEIERKIVGIDELKNAVKWATDLKGSEGAVVKDASKPYSFGEDLSWKKYRKLTPIVVEVIKAVPKKRNLYNYLVGVKADKKYLDPRYIENGKLVLGHTFNTDRLFKEGEKIKILVEEVWRHETDKGIHYSIHKPRVEDKTTENLDGIDYLENIVTSIGVSVKHSFIDNNEVLSGDIAELEQDGEGKEIEIKNFPDRMQSNFSNIIGKKSDYVMQVHTRGNTLHYDIRHKVNANLLEGITLFGRSIQDRLPIETQRNNIRSTIKMAQPTNWLTFEGVTHRGGIGATKHNPGVFTIISKGKFTVFEVTDHKIVIGYKSESGKINKDIKKYAEKEGLPYPNLPEDLINLDGKYSWHIAHIGEHWIVLFDKLK